MPGPEEQKRSDDERQERTNDGEGWTVDQDTDRPRGEGSDNERSDYTAAEVHSTRGEEEGPVGATGKPIDKEDGLKCEKEISDIHAVINSQEAEFDKQLLTLSSALIALSLAFAKEVAPLGPICVPLLLWGLLFLVLCIVAVLASLQISIRGLEKAKEYWEVRREDTWGRHEFPRGAASWIKRANTASGVCFLVGLIAIGSFVLFNVNKEIRMAENPKDTTLKNINGGASLNVPTEPVPPHAGATIKTNPTQPPEKKKD